jgi:type II secretory pathway component PulF
MKTATLSHPGAFSDTLLRLLFTQASRIQFYETLGLLLDNGVSISDALDEVYKTEADADFDPNVAPSRSKPVAVVCYDCISAIRSGKQLSDALAYWVSPMEVSLIVAGERTGSYLMAFERAVLALTKQAELKNAIRTALAYPALLFLLVAGLFGFLGFSLAPQLTAIQPVEKWDPATAAMLSKGIFVRENIIFLVVGFIALVSGTVYSMGHLRGRLRDRLDKVAPWSIYRLFYGSVFLLNIAVMLNCGIGLEEALMMLNDRANPYLSERITNTLRGVRTGRTFGESLKDTEHDFPSRKAVGYIQILSSKNGFDKALEKFTLRSLDLNIKEIATAASMLRLIGLATAGYAIQLIATGLLGISTSAQAIAH